MKILLLILPVVAARAFSSPAYDDGAVTSSKVNKLVSDAVDLYFEGAKRDAWYYAGRMPSVPIQMDDIAVEIYVSNLMQHFGASLSQSQSSYLSEKEFSTYLSVTAAKMEMGGDIEIYGTVKGQPIDKRGKINITIDTLTPEGSLQANHDDNSVTLIDYELRFEYSEPKVDIDIDSNEKELIANAIRNVMKEEVEHVLEEINMLKTQFLPEINRMLHLQHYNLKKVYQTMRFFYEMIKHSVNTTSRQAPDQGLVV